MSWDIFAQDFPPLARTVEDIPEDFEPGCIGQRTDIIARIKEIVPSADFSDPSWGEIEGENYSIDVNIGDDEDVYGIAFHVRGGDGAAIVITDILAHLNLRALDGGTGEFFSVDTMIDSLRRWRGYRDQVVGDR